MFQSYKIWDIAPVYIITSRTGIITSFAPSELAFKVLIVNEQNFLTCCLYFYSFFCTFLVITYVYYIHFWDLILFHIILLTFIIILQWFFHRIFSSKGIAGR